MTDKLITFIAIIGLFWGVSQIFDVDLSNLNQKSKTAKEISPNNKTFNLRNLGSQSTGAGRVIRILPDDNKGRRHQKFILQMPSGQTLLIAHNIDLAPRISGLKEGDIITFLGVYVYNHKGGVIHWTHHAPDNRHPGGWLMKNGKKYQ